MGRFEHLEMGERHPKRPGTGKKSEVLDHAYYMGKATEAFGCEDFERALAYYSRTLEYDINIEEAWLGQLRCLIELGELPEAITWSQRAMERFPKSAQILSARGVAESRLGRPEVAIGFSDSAFKFQGVNAYSWVARGDVLLPMSETNAKACFAKAVELAPSDWSIRAWIARAYLVRKLHHQALESLNVAVRLDQANYTCWYWIGKCNQELRQVDEARVAYKRALAECPSLTRARNALRDLETRGVFARVIDTFRRTGRGSRKDEV